MHLIRKFMEHGTGINHLSFHFDDVTDEWINSKRYDPNIKLWVHNQNNSNFNISTNYSKFGSKSCRAHNRTGQWSVYLPSSEEMTIEFFLLRKNDSNNSVIINGTGNWISLCDIAQLGTGNDITFWTYDGTSYENYIALNNKALSSTVNNYTDGIFKSSNNNYSENVSVSSSIYRCWNASSTWLHVAVTFKQLDFTTIYPSGNTGFNNQVNIYMNGQLAMSGYTDLNILRQKINPLYFSFGDYSYGNYGYIDELRITNKILYTGNTITVPTSAFTN